MLVVLVVLSQLLNGALRHLSEVLITFIFCTVCNYNVLLHSSCIPPLAQNTCTVLTKPIGNNI